MRPLVSVVIPAYNATRFIAAAIDSVLGQSYRELEVIVVDDGSTADLRWLAASYHGRITYVRKERGGPASARNAGLARSRGDYVAFLDADDLWEPEKVAAQLGAFERHPHAGLAYSSIIPIDEEGRRIGTRRERGPRPSGQIFIPLFMSNFIPTSTVMVPRRCFEAVGLFDESRSAVAVEDYDMWLRIVERYEAVALERPLARYRLHPAGLSHNIEGSYANERAVIEAALARWPTRHPALRRLAGRRFHRLYFEFGYDLFTRRERRKARTQFLQSLRYRPLGLKAGLYALATFADDALIDRLRRLKQGVRVTLTDQ